MTKPHIRKFTLSAPLLLAIYSCKKNDTKPISNDNLKIVVDCIGQCEINIDTAATVSSTYASLERNKIVTSYQKSYNAKWNFGMTFSIRPIDFARTSVKVTLDGKVIVDENRTGSAGWGFARVVQ